MVLMYHRIATPSTDRHGLCVSPAAFRQQMHYLESRGYPVLALDELTAAARAGALPAGAVAITFDDGYLDMLTTAAPILREHAFPATFYVVSGALSDGHEFWWDTLERIFISDIPLPARLDVTARGTKVDMPTATRPEREMAHDAVSELFYPLQHDERREFLSTIIAWSGCASAPKGDIRPMTRDELRELARLPGMSVGAHSQSHVYLPTQPETAKRAEIVGSKLQLEEVIDEPVHSFSYPYGGVDHPAARIAYEAAFTSAVTTQAGLVTVERDPYHLPRVNVADTNALIAYLESAFPPGGH